MLWTKQTQSIQWTQGLLMPSWSCHFPSNAKYSVLILYARGATIIFTEGHISIVVALTGPVVTELTTIIYASA